MTRGASPAQRERILSALERIAIDAAITARAVELDRQPDDLELFLAEQMLDPEFCQAWQDQQRIFGLIRGLVTEGGLILHEDGTFDVGPEPTSCSEEQRAYWQQLQTNRGLRR